MLLLCTIQSDSPLQCFTFVLAIIYIIHAIANILVECITVTSPSLARVIWHMKCLSAEIIPWMHVVNDSAPLKAPLLVYL